MELDYNAGAILVFDKPYTWTSFDLVNSIRYSLKIFTGNKKLKVGHAGTLDPLASGLLLVCTGKKTKEIDQLQGLEKEYTGTFVLGATTPSFDLESAIDQTYPIQHITTELLTGACQKFTGTIQQFPPKFSAIKIDGKRAYEYARENLDVEIKSKEITISAFELTRIALPEVDFRVVCSKGTYIRALARDFGEALGSGAYMSALRRTRIGPYIVENALDVHAFKVSHQKKTATSFAIETAVPTE
jgi:tRNA pseudouridine55 synthase